MNSFLPSELIKKKRQGFALTDQEIEFFIRSYTQNQIPDYQMSALLMAIFLNGMSETETLSLTQSMLQSGEIIDWGSQKSQTVDKHSTGGVGDKTSLIIGPLVASLGYKVPMISGRGLGHTGGTLDKLESIPGFNVQLSIDVFKKQVEKMGVSFIGQTQKICPADKKIYALRDVTATVESLPLISASIMSKKLAEGTKGLVLDVKCGNGAFMKSHIEAKKLAQSLIAIGSRSGQKVIALITNMNQPLGSFVGNALEVQECLDIMEGKQKLNARGLDLYQDTRELSIELASRMVQTIEASIPFNEIRDQCLNALTSGKALAVWHEMVREQGGQMAGLPKSKVKIPVLAKESGWLKSIDTERLGVLGIDLGISRRFMTDSIKPASGFELLAKIGEKLEKDEPIMFIHSDKAEDIQAIWESANNCFTLTQEKTNKESLILELIN